MPSIVIADSGALLAAMNAADPDHAECSAVLRAPEHLIVIPALCVAEVAYLAERELGTEVEAAFVESLAEFDVPAPEPDDWPRVADLVRQYAGFPLGTTDASIVALAERLDTDTLLTLDRRHFRAIRPCHSPFFRLLP